jgi:hypothetical protein
MSSKSIPWWAKATIIGGAVGGLVFLGYEAVKALSLPPGGACNDPSSPCYQALKPYLTQFQICADEYAKRLDQFITENAQNGTSFTQAQLDTLNYLTNCMNQASEKMAQIAKEYAPDRWSEVLTYIFYAVLAGIVLKYAPKLAQAINSLRTRPRNGATASSIMYNILVQNAVNIGKINALNASAFMTTTQIMQQRLSAIDTAYYQRLVSLNIASQALATQLLSQELSAMSADFAMLMRMLSLIR